MENDAWKSMFYVYPGGNGSCWLVIEKGKMFSYNGIIYKTEAGAKKGARAAFNKINKEFEKIVLS